MRSGWCGGLAILALLFAAAMLTPGARPARGGAAVISRVRSLDGLSDAHEGNRSGQGRASSPSDLRRAIRGGQPNGLTLARTALVSGDDARFLVALGELSRDPRPEAREVLSEAMRVTNPLDRKHPALQRAWAGSFALDLGAGAAAAAARGLQDDGTAPMDRALFLLAHFAAAPEDRDTYSAYLQDSAPELRRAALQVNGALWDYDALPALLELENGSDPVVRRDSRELVRRYLLWGPVRPTSRQRQEANHQFEPDDRDGYREWRVRRVSWEARQRGLQRRFSFITGR